MVYIHLNFISYQTNVIYFLHLGIYYSFLCKYAAFVHISYISHVVWYKKWFREGQATKVTFEGQLIWNESIFRSDEIFALCSLLHKCKWMIPIDIFDRLEDNICPTLYINYGKIPNRPLVICGGPEKGRVVCSTKFNLRIRTEYVLASWGHRRHP